MDYYDGPVQEVLQLEQLSHAALVVVCKELALQVHLLISSLMLSIEERYGRESADEVALFQMTGTSWVVSERLGHWLDSDSQGIDRLAKILEVHPAFQPAEYIGLTIEKTGAATARMKFSDCPAGRELEGYGWFGLLRAGRADGLKALLKGIDQRATLSTTGGGHMSWDITLDDSVEQLAEPLAVQIAKGTVLYSTRFEDHIPLLHTH